MPKDVTTQWTEEIAFVNGRPFEDSPDNCPDDYQRLENADEAPEMVECVAYSKITGEAVVVYQNKRGRKGVMLDPDLQWNRPSVRQIAQANRPAPAAPKEPRKAREPKVKVAVPPTYRVRAMGGELPWVAYLNGVEIGRAADKAGAVAVCEAHKGAENA